MQQHHVLRIGLLLTSHPHVDRSTAHTSTSEIVVLTTNPNPTYVLTPTLRVTSNPSTAHINQHQHLRKCVPPTCFRNKLQNASSAAAILSCVSVGHLGPAPVVMTIYTLPVNMSIAVN
jgi:hypothetical protein